MNKKMIAILDAKEKRATHRTELQQQFGTTLICFTMNIAGEDKNSPLISLAFRFGVEQLENIFPDAKYLEICDTDAGPTAYICIEEDADNVKCKTTALEEEINIGRLFDMDVYRHDGSSVSRKSRRTCLLCGGNVDACIKAGTHKIEEVADLQQQMLREFAAELLAETAVECLLEEVRLTPKPGLVDAENNGAHKDMDISLFEQSAKCLLPYFKTSVLLGMEDECCMDRLQPAGIEAEKTMFATTNGVNTHKGVIYAFGLILSAIGSHISFGSEIFSTACLLAMDGILPQEETHGEKVRTKYNKCGARYEATEGFPNAISAYNVLNETDSMHRALLWLIASVPDTNLLYRGGIDGLVYAQELAKKTQALDDEHLDGIREMDQKLTEKNLSPGGSADLLALALFLQRTDAIWNED